MKFGLATTFASAAAYGVKLGPYPGYTGDLKVTGEVGAYYSTRSDKVYMTYELQGVEAKNCKTTPEGVANACGIHIHAGTTCDDAAEVGGHYYDTDSIDSDPWSPVTYAASYSGKASGRKEIVIGAKQDISGRAMVVHDSTGARVACALLPAGLFEEHGSVKFGPYPGYTGDLEVKGDASAYYNGNKDEVYIRYHLSGVEADKCKTTPEGVANACGIHIHAGTTCDDASAVGGHYYDTDAIEADPWSPVSYTAERRGLAEGYAKVTIGADQDISGRAMVVHDSTGGRVACALLPTSLFIPGNSVSFGPYPGYTGDLKVTGNVGAYYSTKSGKVYMYYSLRGVEGKECKTAPEGVANACGIHIHAGTTCDDAAKVEGHYFADTIASDPWSPITYSATRSGNSYGTAEVEIGAAQDISGRAMVVHDSTGGRVACALLPASFFMV